MAYFNNGSSPYTYTLVDSGFGISMLNLLETHTRYRFTQVNLNYAYRVPLSADWVFIPSLSFGFGNKDFSFDSLLLEDQIDIPNSIINLQSADPTLLNTTSNFFDFSVGGLIMNDTFWLGIGARHLNRPNISFEYNGNEKLDIFLSVQAGFWCRNRIRKWLNYGSDTSHKPC